MQLELSGSTMVKIIDNSKTFDDTKDHWSRDEVNFVAARELFNGVGGNQFGVSQPMDHADGQYCVGRLAGVDTTPGQGQA
ncbi:MAG: S-layer homology domain-containing protein [Evtepia sp.]